MGMMIAAASFGLVALGLLVTLVVQAAGARRILDELARARISNVKASARTLPSSGTEERLAAIERSLSALLAALSTGARHAASVDRAAMRPPARPERPARSEPAASVGRMRTSDQEAPVASEPAWPDAGNHVASERDRASLEEQKQVEPPSGVRVTPDDIVEAYRDLIARPRKSDIARWFDEVGGISCEAGEDDSIVMVDRGDGARLMLVPLTESFGLLLPSALMVADFPTSFSDVLSARTVLRRTFDLDADGSGSLRLVEAAKAVRLDGTWRLKVPGRLGGLAAA